MLSSGSGRSRATGQLVRLSDHARGLNYFTFDSKEAVLNFVTDHSVTDTGFNLTLENYEKPKCKSKSSLSLGLRPLALNFQLANAPARR